MPESLIAFAFFNLLMLGIKLMEYVATRPPETPPWFEGESEHQRELAEFDERLRRTRG